MAAAIVAIRTRRTGWGSNISDDSIENGPAERRPYELKLKPDTRHDTY
jgi:hypothetical protein